MVTNNSTTGSTDRSEHPILSHRSALRKAILTPLVCTVVASLGVFGGISALFVGSACVILHWFLTQDVLFDRFGTVLFIVAIPMILLGSIFIDEIDQKK